MRKSKIMIMLCAAMLTATASAQQTKVLTADKHNEYGLVYSLPKTAVTYEVTARHTVRAAGPYWQYAKKYLGTDDVIREDAETWEIVSVTATSHGVADPEKEYLMQLKPGATTYIGVAADGMLLSINREPAPVPPVTAYRPSAPLRKPDVRGYLQYVNEDFLSSQSSAKQAQLMQESLLEVRDAKLALTRGTAETMPTDGKQLELMLKSLSEQEKALTEAFTGVEVSETVTRKFTVTPEEEGSVILARVSDFAGFCEADDLSGWPLTLNVEITEEPQIPVNEKGEEKRLPKDAVVYSLPATVTLTLTLKDDEINRRTIQMAQFGATFGLDPKLFTDKKAPSCALFDPATGALRSLSEAGE